MNRVVISVSLLLGLACHPSASGVDPAPAAEATLNAFLRAASDSNLAVMADNWGTSRGSAGATHVPPDYQKRIVIIQVYLAGYRHRILTNEPSQQSSNQRELQVELSKPGCLKVIPFTLVRSGRRWLVFQFDLERIGNPAKSCEVADSTRS